MHPFRMYRAGNCATKDCCVQLLGSGGELPDCTKPAHLASQSNSETGFQEESKSTLEILRPAELHVC